MRIEVPPEFENLCSIFHQDIPSTHSTRDEAIQALINGLTEHEKTTVYDFLNRLLSGRYSTAEIKGTWLRNLDEAGFRNATAAYGFTRRMRACRPDAVGAAGTASFTDARGQFPDEGA